MVPFLRSRFTANATESFCPLCPCDVFSCKFSGLFLNSVKFVAWLKLSCLAKLSYLIGRPSRTRALDRVSQTASPSFWSFVSSSCPPMKKLSRSSESTKSKNLFCIVLPQLLGCPHSENKFFQAGLCSTICLKHVHRHKLLVLICKHNAEPDTRQWLYSEKSHHACEHLLELLVYLGLFHSWYMILCDLDQCAHIAYIIKLPHSP